MKARLVASGTLWEVTEGERWWTVGTLDGLITNEKRVIDPDGPTGKKVLAAVEKAKSESVQAIHDRLHREWSDLEKTEAAERTGGAS